MGGDFLSIKVKSETLFGFVAIHSIHFLGEQASAQHTRQQRLRVPPSFDFAVNYSLVNYSCVP